MKPNIVLIMSDQHNILDYADTPNLDRLYSNGMCFRDAYCSSPLCVPSRAGFLTGQLPSGTGVWNNTQCLSSDQKTFVHNLAGNGYGTVLVGRMHFNLNDQLHGYEKHLVGEITPTFPRPARQKEVYGVLAGSPDQSYVSIVKSGAGHSAVHDYDREVADTACSYIREKQDERPLFMTVGFYGPHCPFVAEKGLYDKYYERFCNIRAFSGYDLLNPEMRRFIDLRGIKALTDEERRRTTAAYYANIEYMDSLIGDVLSAVEERLGLDDTIIIYTSDHGESLGCHGLYWKSNFYRESVNIPLVFSWKDHIRRADVSGPVSLLDIAPTLLSITGSEPLSYCDGINLSPVLLEGAEPDPDRIVISMLADLKGDYPSAMIRRGSYKLIKFCNDENPILFDFGSDAAEDKDFGKDPNYKEIRSILLDQLHKYWDEESAMDQLEKAKAESIELKRWIQSSKPQICGEWDARGVENYILEDHE